MKRLELRLENEVSAEVDALARHLGSATSVVAQALDFYFRALDQEGIKPEVRDGRVERSKLFSSGNEPASSEPTRIRKFRIDDTLAAQVKTRAEQSGASVAAVVKHALRSYLFMLKEERFDPNQPASGKPRKLELQEKIRRLRNPLRSAKLRRFLKGNLPDPPTE